MRQYFITFPDEFIDAARVDGMNEFAIFRKIILPNATPAIATLAILSFRSQWDTLLWPLLITQSEKMKTIPLYIVKFAAEKHADEGAMMFPARVEVCRNKRDIPLPIMRQFPRKMTHIENIWGFLEIR